MAIGCLFYIVENRRPIECNTLLKCIGNREVYSAAYVTIFTSLTHAKPRRPRVPVVGQVSGPNAATLGWRAGAAPRYPTVMWRSLAGTPAVLRRQASTTYPVRGPHYVVIGMRFVGMHVTPSVALCSHLRGGRGNEGPGRICTRLSNVALIAS